MTSDKQDLPSPKENLGLGSLTDVAPAGEKKWKSNLFKVLNVFYWFEAILDLPGSLINPGMNRSAEKAAGQEEHKKRSAALLIGQAILTGLVIAILAIAIVIGVSALLA